MQQKITGYHLDEEQHWVAELACGHNQHVRHNPPWVSRPWVTTPEGRARMHATVVALWLDPGDARALWSHVGDSRLYRLRQGRIDHAVPVGLQLHPVQAHTGLQLQ